MLPFKLELKMNACEISWAFIFWGNTTDLLVYLKDGRILQLYVRLLSNPFLEQIWGGFSRLYMDDIIILSHTLEDHWVHVSKVLPKLQENNIQIAWSKMEIAQRRTEYLGV